MNKAQHKAIRFLRQYQMDPLDVAFDENIDAFLSQMQRGLAGQKSSLQMIPTYLSVGHTVPSGKRVIVADAGGTNFRAATVYFDDHKKAVIENLRLFKMPGIERQLNRKDFFAAMAEYFRDVADAADEIGFCFSYAVDMLPNKDGRMIRFSKEIKTRGVEGCLIGDNLKRAMSALGFGANKHIVLLNDTVATLLAGCGYKNRQFGSLIGFILGTGTNCSYLESNARIPKKKDLDPNGGQIINVESGGMGQGYRGRLDVSFDKTTATPGSYKFEKMISGAYLGPLFLHVLGKACRQGLFSKPVAAALGSLFELDTQEMNEFMQYPYGDAPLASACKQGNSDDTQIIYALADRLTERAAKLTAINLSAIAIKSGQGTDPTRPIAIVAEGTTFYRMKTLKPRVEFYLKQYLENKKGIHTEIIAVENATLIGAAIAGLTN